MATDIKLFESKAENSWCPGCGNFGIVKSIKSALSKLNLLPHEVLIVSGIGQAAKTPHYINVNGFNGLHGRGVPVAVGAKIANKDLKVIVTSGDGDSYGEGGNHLIHNIRRNVDITHLVHDNQIYGLTKGQGSPTTAQGHKTSMQYEGVWSDAFNPIAFAISLGCSFVARSFSANQEHLTSIIIEAMNHKGYALIDILQPCVTFNKVNTYKWYKERVYYLDKDYNPYDKIEAFKKSQEWGKRIPLGVIYKEDKPSFIERVPQLLENPPLVDRKLNPRDVEKFVNAFK